LRSSDVVAWRRWWPNEKSPPRRAGDNSRKSETRISSIADFARECKQKKKAVVPQFEFFFRPRRHLKLSTPSPAPAYINGQKITSSGNLIHQFCVTAKGTWKQTHAKSHQTQAFKT
jgi:hypothetical protein